jgi:hypothetical protein
MTEHAGGLTAREAQAALARWNVEYSRMGGLARLRTRAAEAAVRLAAKWALAALRRIPVGPQSLEGAAARCRREAELRGIVAQGPRRYAEERLALIAAGEDRAAPYVDTGTSALGSSCVACGQPALRR